MWCGTISVIFAALSAATLGRTVDMQKDSEAASRKWGFDWGYSGIVTFGHLPHFTCLTDIEEKFDIAIIGAPFDTAVSYRPGARFGPRAVRMASARHLPGRSFDTNTGLNPYMSGVRIVDCGDIPITPFDNALAERQMNEALSELGSRAPAKLSNASELGLADISKLIILGGDHSIALPALRALYEIIGQPIAVVHFDAHLDTLHPSSYPSRWSSRQTEYTHGSVFWQASKEHLTSASSSVHVGLRTRLTGTDWNDQIQDDQLGFTRIDDIDDVGVDGITKAIMKHVGTEVPVYISVDIDILDPSVAPGTGGPESGGWTMRELKRVLQGIRGLHLIGADIVEVAPTYDDISETTSLAAAQIVYEILSSMVVRDLARDDHDSDRAKKAKSEL